MKHTKIISSNIDEYLEEMYRCEIRKQKITTKGLADALDISMPSVSEMLAKLSAKKLITHTPRKETKLTKKGRKIGSGIYQKHETIKDFFIFLGLEKKKSIEQACRLEHELSDAALKKMKIFLKKQVKK